ncbi:MAG: glutamine-hydrolyzing carbamoyl-phosphate synthase small subunit [Candidatus Rokubacteria bacterium]|nr:glutamine-hydrolyzing carbamoyl-phosphate synthase small subunit [Candidatus Rokubacteria bacterium]
MTQRAILALADGRVFEGQALAARGEAVGEVVFNTAMTGYQEVLTDPSYKGQLVCMTYPLIGNTGVNAEDVESHRPWVEGFIVREASPIASSWRATATLDAYLTSHGIVGIQGLDTRALTRHLRDHGAQEGVISTENLDARSLVAKAKASPGLVGRDLVKEVTCQAGYEWAESVWRLGEGYGQVPASRYHVVAYDSGVKRNILRQLVSLGCRVTVLPAFAPADEVLALKPDGLFLANGPGDPEGVPYLAESVRRLVGRLPVFGICLGHQVLALALGARTYKLKFGHHGANHPVKDLATGRVEITSQNHGFAVDPESVGPNGLEVTHVNLNDNTCEGMRHRNLPVFSVQYHPEASPGPHDAHYLFRRFVDLMDQSKGR